MTIRTGLAVLGTALLLAACSNESSQQTEPGYSSSANDRVVVTGSRVGRSELSSVSPIETVSAEQSRDRGQFDEAGAPDDGNPNFMAYSYSTSLEAPSENIPALFEQHQQACVDAGPSVCQVISANLANQVASQVGGRLHFRAQPAWLEEFRSGLQADTEAAGGRILLENTSSEDLSSPILDTRARLTAQTSLRDRLQALLETEGASVEELVQIERELARVQGEIESATSQLRYLERRVNMSAMTLQYRSIAVPYTQSTTNPIISAINDFLGIASDGLGMVIRLIAGILPWLIIIIPGLWFLRSRWRRWMAQRRG